MGRLKIALLGYPEVEHHLHRVQFPYSKILALLAYLAVEGGTHERQKLARLLWPEHDRTHARTALRNTLHHLRRLLADSEATIAMEMNQPVVLREDHILLAGDTVALNMQAHLDLDIHTLEDAWKLSGDLLSREPVQDEMRRSMIERLQRAVSLYRGDFLHDFVLRDAVDFDDWIRVQQIRWSERVDRVFDCLSGLQRAEGTIEEAILTTQRWHALDPLNEQSVQRLLQLQFAVGNRVAALKTYETYVERVHAELSAEPSPQLTALAHLLRDTPAGWRKKNSLSSSVSSPRLTVPFVGRARELTTLTTLYEQVEAGSPQLAIIEGEAGIGKSLLGDVFLTWVRARGGDVLVGRTFPMTQHLAYQPVLDALRIRLAQEPLLHQHISPLWLGEIARLFPDIRERYPDLPLLTLSNKLASSHLFEAFVYLLQALASDRPQVLFIDDIQWVDSATLDLCLYLCAAWKRNATPVLLLLGRRNETYRDEPYWATWLTKVGQTLPLTRLTPALLSAQDVDRIVLMLSGVVEAAASFSADHHASRQLMHPDEERLRQLSAWLYQQTQGLPFYLQALLDTLLARGLLHPQMGSQPTWTFLPADGDVQQLPDILPASIREMILPRVYRLSSPARDLLNAASVLMHNFSFESLCAVAALSQSAGLEALDETLNFSLLRESDQKTTRADYMFPTYVFAHEKIREVVYGEASAARKQVLHQRALFSLQASQAGAAELAFHALAAGAMTEAYRWSVVAGNEAIKVFAVRDAINHYEQARRLLEHISVEDEALLSLLLHLGDAYKHCNDIPAARACYRMMLDAAVQRQQSTMECMALNALSVVEGEDLSCVDHALAQLYRALALAEEQADRELLTYTHWSIARVYFFAHRIQESFTYAQQAVALARETGRPHLLARCLNTLSYAAEALGRWQDALAQAEEARQLYVAQGDRVMEADCLSKMVAAYLVNQQPRAAIATARSAYAIALDIKHSWSVARCGYVLARGLLEVGSYQEALSIMREGITAARQQSLSILLFVNAATLGCTYQMLFQLEEARELHREALVLSEMLHSPRYLEMCNALLCADCLFAGEWKMAARYAHQALQVGQSLQAVIPEIPRWLLVEALIHAGDMERATAAVRIFERYAETNHRCSISVLRSRALVAQAEGRNEQAITSLQEAVTSARETELQGEYWQAEYALGNLFATCGQEASAQQAWSRARATVEQIASTITEPSMRTGFLNAPYLQRLFSPTVSV